MYMHLPYLTIIIQDSKVYTDRGGVEVNVRSHLYKTGMMYWSCLELPMSLGRCASSVEWNENKY